MRTSSSAFPPFGSISRRYAGDGANLSPPLFWDGPASAVSFAILCEDADTEAPEPFVHWVVYGLRGGVRQLLAGIAEETRDLVQGTNSFGHRYYDGPAPPSGDDPHEYHFEIFALDGELALQGRVDRNALVEAMKGHLIAAGEAVGTYGR